MFEHDVLRWLHVLAFGYWIGGELGVFHASHMVVNRNLDVDERLRHMEVAYRIDIVHRFAIIFLLALGLHMGFNLGIQPLGGMWLVAMWVLVAIWCALTWMTFAKRGSDLGLLLTRIDDRIRYILMPTLIGLGLWSLIYGEPFSAKWYSAKVLIFGTIFIIGLYMRKVMQRWILIFREMKQNGSKPELEDVLSTDMKVAVRLAYVYWVAIIGIAFLGVTKPF
ncbi:MAG: hypothetical protein PVF65_00140 [Sphingomonadales bacterium]|jgi:hypothetical protein